MIPLTERIAAFDWLGHKLIRLPAEDWQASILRSVEQNPWFVESSIRTALEAISNNLTTELLEKWVSPYNLEDHDPCRIGVIMAGNIPLVGFHDFLCVLISGHRMVVKLSSQDNILLPKIANLLINQFPSLTEYISFENTIDQVDAVIATGSDNSARYFKYYFMDIPKIIRKNRSSIGMINGNESTNDIALLGNDIFTYFGLGCRNVSQLFVPRDYDVEKLAFAWRDRREVLQHQKYVNNYRYNKAVLSMNGKTYIDNGLLLVLESEEVIAPVGVLHYQYYKDHKDLMAKLKSQQSKTQCHVARANWLPGSIAFGEAQRPHLWDYADRVDTLEFLTSLS